MKLKTLDQLEEEHQIYPYSNECSHWNVEPKHSKHEGHFWFVRTDNLRDEAIKWIKEDHNSIVDLEELMKGKEVSGLMMCSYLFKLLNKWKKRLNLPEEDLK